MAYFNQEMKAEKAKEISKLAKEYGVKLTLAVRHHSTFVCNIKSSSIDFFGEINEDYWHQAEEVKARKYMNPSHINDAFLDGKARDFLKKLKKVMMEGNHDNSDTMTDYFDVGWYVDIKIGNYDKPYQLI